MNILFRLLLIIIVITLVACSHNKVVNLDPAHNSENSLDWSGVYHALLPCNGCSGVDVWVSLSQAGNRNFYELVEVYRGSIDSKLSSQGEFAWSKTGNQINFVTNRRLYFFDIMEGRLQLLNSNAQPLENPELYQFEQLVEYKHNGSQLLVKPQMIQSNKKAMSFSGIVNLEHPAMDNHRSSKLNVMVDCSNKTHQVLSNRRFKQHYAAGTQINDPATIKSSDYHSKITGLVQLISTDYCK